MRLSNAHRGTALGLALLAGGCQQRSGVALTVRGLTAVPSFAELQVTVQRDGEAPRVLEPYSREALGLKDGDAEVTLGIDLEPPSATGRLAITVAAADPAQAWVLAQGGQSDLELRPGRNDAEVTLQRTDLCSKSGWCWEWPTPSGRLIYALWGSAKDDVWAVGAFGTLLHYNGRTWSPVELPGGSEVDLYGLWGSGRDDVWAVGGTLVQGSLDADDPRGVVLHFDGQSWRAVPGLPAGTSGVLAVAGVGRGEVWVSGASGKEATYDSFLLRCTPEGCDGAPEHLTAAILGEAPSGTWALFGLWSAGVPGAPVWAAGYYGPVGKEHGVILQRRAGQGERWRLVHKLPEGRALTHIWGQGADVWAAKLNNPYPGIPQQGGIQSIWRRDPGTDDSKWTEVTTGEKVFPLWQDEEGTRWGRSVQDQRVARLAADYGGAWDTQLVLGAQLAVHGTAADDVWAAGTHGEIHHFDGQRWDATGGLPLPSRPLPYLFGMYARSATEAWAVGERGTILHLDGGAWKEEVSGTEAELRGVTGFGDEVFVVGRKGTLLRRRGAAWVQETIPTTADLFDVWGSGPGDLFAVGDVGTILRWDDLGGGRWTAVRSTGPRLYGVWGSVGPGQPRWAVGCTNPDISSAPAAVRLRAGTWEDVPPPNNRGCFETAWFVDEAKIWVGGPGTGVYLYDGTKGQWTLANGLNRSGRFGGTAGGDLWLVMVDSLLRGNEMSQKRFDVGTYSQFLPGGNLLLLGQERWYYGYGIVHCKRGLACAAPRR